ncbi:MAG: NAD(P)H-dependent oxidoreductase [Lachnospiraceae bacterium]|nr:NAD(P)H-dependent oxidoreductase [Lachnospiraceae bacterium]
MSILFINGSPNKKGNTVSLAETLLDGKEYNILHLVEYKLYSYGQEYEDDMFLEIVEQIKKSDTIVIGSPLYWHSMSGAVRNLLDRTYGAVPEDAFAGKDLFFVFQGAAPTKEQLAAGEYTISRYAGIYGMNYKGMATCKSEAAELAKSL